MEKLNDIRAQNKKQAACKIISWVTDKNCKIPPAHELKKWESNGKLLTAWGKIRTVKNSDFGLENVVL